MPNEPALRSTAPTCAVPLLSDERVLAVLARTALAASDHGWLHTRGWQTHPALLVQCVDDDGEPQVRDALYPERPVPTGRHLMTLGNDGSIRLTLYGTVIPSVDGSGRISVERVVVGCPHGHGRDRELDMIAYAEARPDEVLAHGPRLLAHLNHAHPEQLRRLAAGVFGVGPGDVAAARLEGLNHDGVDLAAVTLTGGAQRRLAFARRVRTVRGLRDELSRFSARRPEPT